MEYRYGSHTVFSIEYHFVRVTRYRYPVLQGDVAHRVKELVRQSCEAFEIRIISGVVSKDHVHLSVSAPPTMAPGEIMRRLEGRTSSKLFGEFPNLKKRYRGQHFRSRGDFCATSGQITDEMIKNYDYRELVEVSQDKTFPEIKSGHFRIRELSKLPAETA